MEQRRILIIILLVVLRKYQLKSKLFYLYSVFLILYSGLYDLYIRLFRNRQWFFLLDQFCVISEEYSEKWIDIEFNFSEIRDSYTHFIHNIYIERIYFLYTIIWSDSFYLLYWLTAEIQWETGNTISFITMFSIDF